MSDLARNSLCNLIKQYGPLLGSDPKRCEGLLKDYCGEEKREIMLIVNAAKEGIPESLSGSQTNMPRELLVRNLIDRLQNNVGIEEKYAHWAVESWALALGVEFPEISIKSSEPSIPIPPKPPSPPPEPPIVQTPRRGLNWKLVVGLGAIVVFITVGIKFFDKFKFDRGTLLPTNSPSPTPSTPKPIGDYKQLQNYLKSNDLENADIETYQAMLKVAGEKSQKQGVFDLNEWENFPCEDLKKIDRLWLEATSGKQGFTPQVKINNTPNLSEEEIARRLGWDKISTNISMINGSVQVQYSDRTNNSPVKLKSFPNTFLPITFFILPYTTKWHRLEICKIGN